MKAILGLLLVIIGVAVGLYFGIWWAFIGGIVAIIEQVRAPHLDAMTVALSVARIVFAGGIGWVCGLVLIVPGGALISSRR